MSGHCTGVTIVRYPGGGSIRELVINMADGSAEVYKVTDDTGCALGDARYYALGSCVTGEPPEVRTEITEGRPGAWETFTVTRGGVTAGGI